MSKKHYGLNPPLAPRRGNVLKVVGVARISTEHQDLKSLADQEALYRDWLESNVEGKFELIMISSRGSGERLDRLELTRLDDYITSGTIDLVLTEDLGRLTRRVHTIIICEDCVDNAVRLIALNDLVDTAQEDWRMSSMFATMRHELYNKDTASRIRRTQRNRFLNGEQLRAPLFCYHQPPDARSDSEMSKIPEMIPIVEEMFRRLEEGHSFAAIADYLNEQHVPCGRAAKTSTWSGPHVKTVVYNPILKGVRVRNRKRSIRINKTGRRKAIPAPPEDLVERLVPHLAFIDGERYDRLVRKLRDQNAIFDVRRARGDDPRAGRPKKRSRFPGQLVICGICNRQMVFGGNGRAIHLMCNGARVHKCWNGSTFDAELACDRISEAILQVIESLPQFEPEMLRLMSEESGQLFAGRTARRKTLEQDAARNERERKNILDAVKASGNASFFQDEIERLEAEKHRVSADLSDLDAAPTTTFDLPPIDEIKQQAILAINELARTSYDFAMLMRRMIPRIVAMPVRLCDGGYVETRLKFQLCLDGFVPPGCRVPSVAAHLSREIVVDAFEPAQRAKFLHEVVRLREQGLTERAVAAQLGLTVTATQRAAKLHRAMQSMGLTDPYVAVLEQLIDFPRMKRHLHPRYRFDPLPSPDEAA